MIHELLLKYLLLISSVAARRWFWRLPSDLPTYTYYGTYLACLLASHAENAGRKWERIQEETWRRCVSVRARACVLLWGEELRVVWDGTHA